MKYAIVYWSRYGNNERIANKLRELLSAKGVVEVAKAGSAQVIPKANVYIFTSPAEKFSIPKPMRTLMKSLIGLDGKYIIINTHALKFKNWLGKMDKLLSKSGLTKIAELDLVVGKGTKRGEGLPIGWEAALQTLVEKI